MILNERQYNIKSRSPILFRNKLNPPAMFADDAGNDAQPQPCAVFLGGKERIKNGAEIFFGNAFTAVSYGNMDLVLSWKIVGVNFHEATRLGCTDGIEHKIDEGLLDLAFVHENHRQI